MDDNPSPVSRATPPEPDSPARSLHRRIETLVGRARWTLWWERAWPLAWVPLAIILVFLPIVLPLVVVSTLAEALMAVYGIGLKVNTLPVVALGVGIGVDYGIYIYQKLDSLLKEGYSLQEAYYRTLRLTGRAVIFTGFTLAAGVGTWIFSPLQFQADMGILLAFTILDGMTIRVDGATPNEHCIEAPFTTSCAIAILLFHFAAIRLL